MLTESSALSPSWYANANAAPLGVRSLSHGLKFRPCFQRKRFGCFPRISFADPFSPGNQEFGAVNVTKAWSIQI